MSRLERVLFETQTIPMKLHGSINIPEQSDHLPLCTTCDLFQSSMESSTNLSPPDHLSPTHSIDSGRSTGTVCGPSTKYFIHGGPGFSLGVLDSVDGSVNHLPIPVPIFPIMRNPDCDNFSLSQIVCMTISGECQVWAGTESGSLHVFDLTPGLRLSFHAYTKLPDPVTMITTGQPLERERSYIAREERQRHRMEVLVGSPNGTLTIITGEANERGGLKNALKCPRKVIQLDNFGEIENTLVNTAVMVTSHGIDTYWCGCGDKIVVLRRSDWKEVTRLDACDEDLPSLPEDVQQTKGSYITQLVNSEHGVWSTVSQSSSMLLWDRSEFTPKLKITCYNHCPMHDGWSNDIIYITYVTTVENMLLVGTNGGHLLVFRIQERQSPPRYRNRYLSGPSISLDLSQNKSPSNSKLTYKLLAGKYCGPRPIVSIHANPVRGDSCCSPLGSPLRYTPGPTLNLLVVLDSQDLSLSVPQGQVQMFELVSSPQESPLTSPMNLSGRVSSSSMPSRVSYSLRRDSLSELGSSLPKLSLAGVAANAMSCLPLQDSD